MKAYLIFVRRALTDPAEMALYGDKVPASLGGHDIKVLARYGRIEALEGPPTEGAVVLEFKTMAEARAWYGSEAYQAAAVHRRLGSDYDVLLIEGV